MIITYKIIRLISLALIFSSFMWSCKTNKIDKRETKSKNLAILDSLQAQKTYFIDIDVVYPFTTMATTQVTNFLMRNTGNNATRIDVRGEGNYLEIKNDSVKAYLPFFGERRLNSGAYGGTDNAIQIEEELEHLDKAVDTSNLKLELKFKAHQKGSDNESYDIDVAIYPNQNVVVNITPVYKTFIRYDGRLEDKDVGK